MVIKTKNEAGEDVDLTLTAEQITEIKTAGGFLTKAEIEADQTLFENYKGKHKKEVLDGFDAELKKHESDLTTDEKAELAKATTTFAKTSKLVEIIKARKQAGIDSSEIEIWKAEVDKERKLREEGFIAKSEYQNLEKVNSQLNKQMVQANALSEAHFSGILSKEFSEKPIFKTILEVAVKEVLDKGIEGKQAKAVYDLETGKIKIVQKSGEPLPIVKSGTSDYWELSDVVKKAIIDNGMNATAQTPKVEQGQKQEGGMPQVGINLFQKNRLEELNNKNKT